MHILKNQPNQSTLALNSTTLLFYQGAGILPHFLSVTYCTLLFCFFFCQRRSLSLATILFHKPHNSRCICCWLLLYIVAFPTFNFLEKSFLYFPKICLINCQFLENSILFV